MSASNQTPMTAADRPRLDDPGSGGRTPLLSQGNRFERTLWQQFAPASDDLCRLSPLWVGGLTVFVMLTVHLVLGGPDGLAPRKLYDWALYIPLGLVFALTLGFAWFSRNADPVPSWSLWLPSSLALIALAGIVVVMAGTNRWIAIPLAAGQSVMTAVLLRRTSDMTTREIASILAAALAGWVAAIPLIWWEPLQSSIQRRPAGLAGVAVVAILVTWWAAGPLSSSTTPIRLGRSPVWADRAIDSVVILVLLLLSIRTDGLIYAFQPIGVLSHWGAFVGPAQQVQEGGWLLWDVPAIYGPLLTWTLAALPVSSSWQSLYVLNAVTLFLTALALYGVLRALRPDSLGRLLALALTIPAVFLAALWPPDLLPTHYFPSFGPVRYIWCYVLIAVLAFEMRQPRGSRGQSIALGTGMIGWLIAVLWSFETAVFYTAIWLPTYALILFSSKVGDDGWRANARRLIVPLALPFVLLAALASGVATFYVVRLGHLPDLRGYVEYVFAFGSGDVSQNYHVEQNIVVYTDAHLVIFLVLAVIAAAAALVLRARPSARELPLLFALWAGVWLFSGYSIARPHPHTVFRSWPLMLVGMAVSILVVARHVGWRPTFALRAALVPLATMLLVLTYSNVPSIERNVRDLTSSRTSPLHVAAGMPDAEPELQELLTRAGIGADEPFVYDGDIGGNPMPAWVDREGRRVEMSRSWLPNPLVELILLPEERRFVTMQRMAERRRLGGWYVQRNGDRVSLDGAWEASGPWFFEQLARTHVPTRSVQNDAWQLIWFDYTGGSSELKQPDLPQGRIVPAPSQVYVDGTSINTLETSSVWLIPGEDWSQGLHDRGLKLELPARASIFSESERLVTITVSSERRIDADSLELRRDGVVVGRFVSGDRRTASIRVHLDRGWNDVTIGHSTVDIDTALITEGSQAIDSGRTHLLLDRVDIAVATSSSELN